MCCISCNAPQACVLNRKCMGVQVTQAAANIVRLRPPSVYKGKGIRLADAVLRLKAGKTKGK